MLNTFIVLIAKDFIYLAALITVVVWWQLKNADKLRFALQFAMAAIVATILSKTIAHFYFDPRPFVVRHATPLFAHAPDNGFPSDHTTVTMLAAMIVYWYVKPVGLVLAGMAIVIGLARVLSLIHSPIDIIGSIVIAAASTLIGLAIVHR